MIIERQNNPEYLNIQIYVVYMYIYLPMYAINLNAKEMLIALCNSNKTTTDILFIYTINVL